MSRPTPAEREAQVKILVVASEEFQRAKNKPIAGIRAKMEAKEAEIFERASRDHQDNEVARVQQYYNALGIIISTFGAGALTEATTAAGAAAPAAAAPAAAAAAAAAPAAAAPAVAQSQTRSVDEEYWRMLDRLRRYKHIAEKYIGTLQKERERIESDLPCIVDPDKLAQAQKKRKYFLTVEKHCGDFARRCEDTRESYEITPNLRNLQDMETLLQHIRIRPPAPSRQSPAITSPVAPTAPVAPPKPAVPPKSSVPPATPSVAAAAPKPPVGATAGPAVDSKGYKLHCDAKAWKAKVAELTWDRWKIRNDEKQYSYGTWDGRQYTGVFRQEPCLRCTVCQHWIYRSDITAGVIPDMYLDFQSNYLFTCKRCNVGNECKTERFELTKCENWIDAIVSAMTYKTWTEQRKLWKIAEIQDFVTEPEHWKSLCFGRPPAAEIGKNGWDPNPFFTRNKNKVVVHTQLEDKAFWELCDPAKATKAALRGMGAAEKHTEIEKENAPHYADPSYKGAAVQPCDLLKPGSKWAEPPAKVPVKDQCRVAGHSGYLGLKTECPDCKDARIPKCKVIKHAGHGGHKSDCKECNPPKCLHGNVLKKCKECNPSKCTHGKLLKKCRSCNPVAVPISSGLPPVKPAIFPPPGPPPFPPGNRLPVTGWCSDPNPFHLINQISVPTTPYDITDETDEFKRVTLDENEDELDILGREIQWANSFALGPAAYPEDDDELAPPDPVVPFQDNSFGDDELALPLPFDDFEIPGASGSIASMIPQVSVDPAALGPGQISSTSNPAGNLKPLARKGMESFMSAPVSSSDRAQVAEENRQMRKKRRQRAAENASQAVAKPLPKPAEMHRQTSRWINVKHQLFTQSSAHVAACRVCNQRSRELGNEMFNSRVCIVCEDALYERKYGQSCHFKNAVIPEDKSSYRACVQIGQHASNAIPYEVHLCEKHYLHYKESGEELRWAPSRSDGSVRKERVLPVGDLDFQLASWRSPREQWIKCDACGEEFHHRCILYDKDIYKQERVRVLCPNPTCTNSACLEERENDRIKVQRTANQLGATPLSTHLEEYVSKHVFGDVGSEKITIRLVSNVEREQRLPQAIIQRYNLSDELRYQQKFIMAFVRNPDDTDVAFFAMQVLEYSEAKNALEQYQNCAYIAYIESVGLYHLPKCAANHASKIGQECSCPKECHHERSRITQTIFQGYLQYLQLRHFRRAYLWAMAPNAVDSDFLFHMRPRDTYLTTLDLEQRQKKLEEWYRTRLSQAQQAGIISSFADNAPDEAGKRRDAGGVLFHGAADDATSELSATEQTLQPDSAVVEGRGRKRRKPDQYRPEDENKRAQLARESGPSVSLSKLMVFPGDSVTQEAVEKSLPSDTASTRSGASAANGARSALGPRTDSRRVSNRFIREVSGGGKGSHFVCHFKPLAAGPQVEDDPTISIDDETRDKTLDDRDNLVDLCKNKHYQFDTLRMGKYSTMMLLQHFLYPKYVEPVTHRPVMSRQQSSRAGSFLTRQITSEVASAQFIADRLSHQDNMDSRLLSAMKADLLAESNFDAVMQSHTSALHMGVSTPERVVKLLQHGAKFLGLRKLFLVVLKLMPTDANVLETVIKVVQEHLGAAKFKQLADSHPWPTIELREQAVDLLLKSVAKETLQVALQEFMQHYTRQCTLQNW